MDLLLGLAAVVIAALIFRRVAREEITHEDTADAQMWARDLGYYQHRNEKPACRQGQDGPSRIAESAATTNSTQSAQG